MTLPARDEIHPHHAGVDADGDPIPGSYVMSDVYTIVPELGDEILTFDAARAVAHILGIRLDKNKKMSEATSRLAHSGVSLCPMNPTKAVWQQIAEEGGKRSFLVDVDNARILISDIATRDSLLQQHGKQAPPGGAEYDRAVFLLQQYNEMTRGKTYVPPLEAEAASASEELELDVFIKARAMELATKAAASTQVRNVDLAKSMLEDPVILSKLRAEGIRIRKRGYPAKTKAELDKAAAAHLESAFNEPVDDDEAEVGL
jgi:hypothetical protein